ncbi:MAG: class C sortase [Lachnospiraceae bacterium]|nr:class C sortase [Lachnospiraceae bacterium]
MKRRIIFWTCLIAAVVLLLKPIFLDALSSVKQTNVISGYEIEMEAAADEQQRILDDAKAYNEKLFELRQHVYFTYQGEEATDDDYERQLSHGTETMASISYPMLGIFLPVVHGTREKDLEYAAGHMYGSSLPVGGPSVHAVIAGHTGLPEASLFTPLAKAHEGDKFYIKIMDIKLTYEVDQINVVLPEEEDAYLQIEDGMDYVTLYTCTPYGINDHRLLVRGRRVYMDDNDDVTESSTMTVEGKNKAAIAGALTAGLVPIALIFAGISDCRRYVKVKKNDIKKYDIKYRTKVT